MGSEGGKRQRGRERTNNEKNITSGWRKGDENGGERENEEGR